MAVDVADGEAAFPAFEILYLAEGDLAAVVEEQVFILGKGALQFDLVAIEGGAIPEVDEIERIAVVLGGGGQPPGEGDYQEDKELFHGFMFTVRRLRYPGKGLRT